MTDKRKCGAKLAILAALLTISANAAAGDIGLAKDYIGNGQPGAAYENLSADLRANWNDPEYLYVAATAAVDSRRALEAIPIFRRVVELTPNNHGARFDLGRALWMTGEYDSAMTQFSLVETENPPAMVVEMIGNYKAEYKEYRRMMASRIKGGVELSTGYDTNINAATSRSDVVIPLLGNAVLTMNPASMQTSSSFLSVAASIENVKPLSQHFAAFGSARASAYDYTGGAYDSISPDIAAGVLYASGRKFAQAGAMAYNRYVAGNLTQDTFGINAGGHLVIDARNRIGLFYQISEARFHDVVAVAAPVMQNENFTQQIGGVNWGRDGDVRGGAALMCGYERASNRLDGDKSMLILQLSAATNLAEHDQISVRAGHQTGSYKKQNPIFLVAREDRQITVGIAYEHSFGSGVSLKFDLSGIKNNSNIQINSFSRYISSITARLYF